MFCPNCGAQNEDVAAFCQSCGQKIPTIAAGPAAPDSTKKRLGTGAKIAIIAGAVLLAAALAVVLFTVFRGKKEEKPRIDEIGLTLSPSDSSSANNNSVPDSSASSGSASSDSSASADTHTGSGTAPGSDDPIPASIDDGPDPTEEPAPSLEPTPTPDVLEILPVSTSAGMLQSEIIELNSPDRPVSGIEIFEDNYSPQDRNTSYKWDETVFYTLEGYSTKSGYTNKIHCNMVNRRLRNLDTGNMIDYEMYMNPSSGMPNKIVSIERSGDGLEICEYYYTNDGRINFIFVYNTDNYVSSFATVDKYGERYLFNKDVMVTWRIIDASGKTNYAVGANEKERMRNQFSNIKLYDSLDSELQKKFRNKEKRMINAAYNTLNALMNSDAVTDIQGYVLDADGFGIPGAVVSLYTDDFASRLYRCETDRSGLYSVCVPSRNSNYNIHIYCPGYDDCNIYDIPIAAGQAEAYQNMVRLFNGERENSVPAELFVGDAFNYAASGSGMEPLGNADVNIRRGINSRTGEVVLRTNTNAFGYLYLELEPGMYTAEVNLRGYETMYYTFSVNSHLDYNRYEFYAAPTMQEGEIMIVLTWGERPTDLDSHLFTTASDMTHIWYGDKWDKYNSYLDVDERFGYGPETITIRNFSDQKYYKYCVVDYTDCANGYYSSRNLSMSGATVTVYNSNGLVSTMHVPTDVEAVIWEVFEIRNGNIIPIQRYYSSVSDKSWWNSER